MHMYVWTCLFVQMHIYVGIHINICVCMTMCAQSHSSDFTADWHVLH